MFPTEEETKRNFPVYSAYSCQRCGSDQTACFLVDHRMAYHPEFGKAEDWEMSCICSNCGRAFEVIDGYP
jgi:ribosomal protein L37E